VANESVGLMIMQTLRHLDPSPRSLHLRRIHHFSLPPAPFDVLFSDGIIRFDGIISFDGIMDIIYSLLSDASACQLPYRSFK